MKILEISFHVKSSAVKKILLTRFHAFSEFNWKYWRIIKIDWHALYDNVWYTVYLKSKLVGSFEQKKTKVRSKFVCFESHSSFIEKRLKMSTEVTFRYILWNREHPPICCPSAIACENPISWQIWMVIKIKEIRYKYWIGDLSRIKASCNTNFRRYQLNILTVNLINF